MSGLLSLKWNNHSSAFLNSIKNLKTKENYCDATIVCQGKYLKVHRMVLSTCSVYFEEMFDKMQCQHPYIVFNDVEFRDMELMLNYMYEGEVNVLQENLPPLIRVAEYLKIKGLAVPDDDLSKKESSTSKKKQSSSKQKVEENNKQVIENQNSVTEEPTSNTIFLNNSLECYEMEGNMNIKEEPFQNNDYAIEDLKPNCNVVQASNERQNENCFDFPFANQNSNLKTEDNTNEDLQRSQSQPWDKYDINPLASTTTNAPSPSGIFSENNRAEMNLTSVETLMNENSCDGELEGDTPNSSYIYLQTKSHNCSFCSYKSRWKSHVKRHIMFKHTKEQPFSCPICFRRFTLNHNLQAHIRVHTKEKPYRCNKCHKSFGYSCQLKLHMINHHQINAETTVEKRLSLPTLNHNS